MRWNFSPKNKKLQEGTFLAQKIKENHSEKIYISGYGTFLSQA